MCSSGLPSLADKKPPKDAPIIAPALKNPWLPDMMKTWSLFSMVAVRVLIVMTNVPVLMPKNKSAMHKLV